jgi:hypothetical protein
VLTEVFNVSEDLSMLSEDGKHLTNKNQLFMCTKFFHVNASMLMETSSESPSSTEQTSESQSASQKRLKAWPKNSESNIKRKRVCLTVGQKIEICKAKDANPRLKNNKLAARYGVGEATISDILKKKEHFMSIQPNDYAAN